METMAHNRAQVKALLFDKASTAVLAKYSDYSNVFLVKNKAKLPEHIGLNNHVIKLEEDKQPVFGLIYSLRLVKLKTLRTYIKTNLASGFIRSFTSPNGASILFDRKLDGSLRLYIDYWGFNNITIKN